MLPTSETASLLFEDSEASQFFFR